MRKQIVLVLLVPILALTLISCDADMRTNFANFLGGLGGNVYIDGGLVEANKEDVKAAVATISGLGSDASLATVVADDVTGKADVLGVPIDPPAGVTKTMPPQPKADQNKLKDDLSNTLNSPQQTAELKEELKKPVSDDKKEAVKGTVEVFNATIEALASEVTDGDLKEALGKLTLPTIQVGDTVTEGDVLLVQMMTNLISNTIGTLNDIKGDAPGAKLGDNLEANKDKLLSVIDDALFTAKIASDVVGASTLNLLEGLDIQALTGKGSRQSRNDDDGFALSEVGDYISVINKIGPKLVRLFDLKLSGSTYDWKDGGYRRLISNFQAYRLSLEHALAFYRAGKLDSISQASLEKLDETTPVLYLLSVVLTEADAHNKTFGKNLITNFMTENIKFARGTLTASDKLTYNAEENKKDFEAFGEWLAAVKDDDDKPTGRGKEYAKTFFLNVQTLDEIGGSGYIGLGIEDFLTKKDTKGYTEFDNFWKDLTGEGV